MNFGPALLNRLRNQVNSYGVTITHSRVTKLIRREASFVGCHERGDVTARSVLIATGIVDVKPKMEKLEQAIAKGSVRYCPVCDGFEAPNCRESPAR